MELKPFQNMIGGKISIFATLLGVGVILSGLIIDLPHGNVARANVATSTVTVLNTPPTWLIDAQENATSSTSTPTNSGSNVTFVATAVDSSNDNYYLLICKTSGLPTPNNGAPPECNGGVNNRWARSASTASGAQASAATTTYEVNAEFNVWFAWICDSTTPGSACLSTYKQGNGQAASPFVVNHRPVFTLYANDSPKNPGQLVTWSATITDQDTYQGTGTDTVRLFVCKGQDFTGTACGPLGTWATTSPATTTTNQTWPTATTTLTNPMTDGQFGAYGYVIDSHGNHASLGFPQGANSALVVNNMTPTITAASVSLLDTDGTGPLTLTGMATQTAGFKVEYTVTDQNSCQTASGTPEIVFGLTDVYRSGITQAGCSTAGQYNANNCYTGKAAASLWQVSCVASTTAPCLGTSDSDIVWDCTFPLWFLADATDGTGAALTDPPSFAQNWLASAQAADNNFATSSLVESSVGTELNSFLAYNVSTTTIAYGGLQPGQFTTPNVGDTVLDRSDVISWGNVGLDETLYGTDMCTTYPACPVNAATTIPVTEQRYATSTLAYGSATALLLNPGATLDANVKKSTSTTSPEATTTYWGINVPGTITLSGDYVGVNTIIAITGQRVSW